MSESTKSAIAAGLFVLVVLFACICLGYYFGNNRVVEAPPAPGSATIMAARVATSSTIQVGPQQNKTLFALNAQCASRTIGTAGQGVMLAFDGVMTPGGAVGFWQPASTTVTYRADENGCAAVTAYAGASTTISIAEANR